MPAEDGPRASGGIPVVGPHTLTRNPGWKCCRWCDETTASGRRNGKVVVFREIQDDSIFVGAGSYDSGQLEVISSHANSRFL